MPVLFEIRTHAGTLHTGHVLGNGGCLGGGAAHCGPEGERQTAVRELQRIIDVVNATGEMPKGIARRPGGCCVLVPNASIQFATFEAYRAAAQNVPMAGASFRVLN